MDILRRVSPRVMLSSSVRAVHYSKHSCAWRRCGGRVRATQAGLGAQGEEGLTLHGNGLRC
jgi:hypothetical protein